MKGEKKIRGALPQLTERELWMLACDAHRAADAAALGGASERRWHEYCQLETDVRRLISQKYPQSTCPFPRACSVYVDGWTQDERDELAAMYHGIFKGGKARKGAGK